MMTGVYTEMLITLIPHIQTTNILFRIIHDQGMLFRLYRVDNRPNSH